MRSRPMLSTFLLTAALVLPAAARAGCATGAIVGGVAGHVAGGHGLLGAGAGCVIAHEHDKHQAEKAQRSSPGNGGQPDGAPGQGND